MALAANDLIIESLEELEAMTAGDPLNTTDGLKGLSVLNRLIDTGNAGRGNIYSQRTDTYTLTIGKQSYTIGVDASGVATADFTSVRPVRITRANLLMISGSSTIRRKIKLLTDQEWQRKKLQNVAGLPVEVYNDGGNPLSTLWFYQNPDTAYQVELYTWQQFAQIPAATAIGTVTTNGTAVVWASGTNFTGIAPGTGIVINGVTYVVSVNTDSTHLTLRTSAGVQTSAVPYVSGGIATLIQIPPGYYEYWLYSLAIRLAAPFGRTPSATTIAAYDEAKEAVQSLNSVSPRTRADGDLPGGGGGLYNWLSGEVDDE